MQNNIEDEQYLSLLEKGLKEAICECQPDFVVYNAGTDVLRGDCLGKMSLTPEVVKRLSIFHSIFSFIKLFIKLVFLYSKSLLTYGVSPLIKRSF